MSCLSVFANLVTSPPTLCAIPVSKKAAPIINIAINKSTFESVKPAKASLASKIFVSVKPTATIIAVTHSGIFSHANITIAKSKNPIVIVCVFIAPSLNFVDFIIRKAFYLIYPYLKLKFYHEKKKIIFFIIFKKSFSMSLNILSP